MRSIIVCLCSILSAVSIEVFAGCSPYVGAAAINEISLAKTQGKTDGFVEFKLINNAIPESVYDDWSMEICHDVGNGNNQTKQCTTIDVGDMDDTSQWLFISGDSGSNVLDTNYLNLKDGFDISLKDGNDDFIDYIQINNYSGQTQSCAYDNLAYVYDTPATNNGTVILLRSPDGTGAWFQGQNNNAYIATPGRSNDGDAAIIHHFEIIHDGSGLTCDVEPITIKACVNSDCTTLSTESVTLDFQVLDSTSSVTTKASPTFTGSGSFNFGHTEAQILHLSVANATLSATNAFQCTGFGTSCAMTFANAGFRFLYDTSNEPIIAAQTAGINFAKDLKLQAVKDVSGVCEGVFSGNVDVSLAQLNVAPNDNAGLSFQVAGNNIAKYPSFTDHITLNFTSDSIATIANPNYFDAGKISLHAKYSVADINLVGNSNDFWVKPDHFEISASSSGNNLVGNSASSTIIHKAGDDFTLTVSAVNAQGGVTQNYRQTDGRLQFKLSRVLPVLNNTVDGQLTYADGVTLLSSTTPLFQDVTLSSFRAGTFGVSEFSAAQYSEVGVIDLDIQDSNYSSQGEGVLTIAAINIAIGRFTPAYFKQTVSQVGNFDAYQSAVIGCSMTDWAYAGQRTDDNKGSISYGIEPIIAITAYNANGVITKNYTLGESADEHDNFMKLIASGVDISLPEADDEQLTVANVANDFVAIAADMSTGTLSASIDDDDNLIAGQWLYTFSTDDHYRYERNDSSFLAPFAAKIPFSINQITDSDGITLAASLDATEDVVTTGVDIHFARLVLSNAFGSEHAALRSPLYMQTYTGSGFENHDSQNCLTPLIGDKKSGAKYDPGMALWDYRLIDIDSDAITVNDSNASVLGNFERGSHSNLFFSEPGRRGTLEWEYQVPIWLKSNGNGIDENSDSNLYDDNPSATLTFGLYRGNDRIISWQEVTN